jgi:hypothetical protein
MLSNIVKTATTAAAPSADPNFKQTVLLLHGDGTNGAQNNTFVDGSSNNFTITRNGNTTQGTFTPFSQPAGYWSNFFDGTGDYLSAPANTAFNFGTDSFTIECWFYLTGNAALRAGNTRDAAIFSVESLPSVNITFYIGGNSTTTGTLIGIYKNTNTEEARTVNTTISQNTWHHVAVSKDGSNIRLFLNGTQVGSTLSSSTAWGSSTNGARVGRLWNTDPLDFPGYISNLRVVKGTAVYTSNFTPSTTPLTAITNTSLLTCQDNRFRDGSSNNFAITRNGDVRVRPFSPFAPTAAYSTSVNGGSGYFDGSGDFLTVANNSALQLGSSNFTVESWVYYTNANATNQRIFNNGSSAVSTLQFVFVVRADYQLTFSYSFNGSTSNPLVTSGLTAAFWLNQWHHVAAVRNGSNLTVYIDGVSVATTTISSALHATSAPLYIGTLASSEFWFGYISNARIVKGTAVYTSNFTPPTTPLTAITNTSLLLNFTNAGIIDNTGKNVLETTGNAQIDTTIKKYGTGALEFDASGDYLIIPASPDTIFGTGAFTIECWAYPTSFVTENRRIISKGTTGSSANWLLTFLTTGAVSFAYNNTTDIQSSALSLNTWYHIAVVGNGSTITLYIDGVSASSVSYSYNYSENSIIQVSRGRSTTSTQSFNGYIDDLRITKGVARYTTNFTPPTAAFLDQ